VPLGEIVGWFENSALLSVLTAKLTTWEDSLAGPAEMLFAKPATVCVPAS
jgi:hypothetical protein